MAKASRCGRVGAMIVRRVVLSRGGLAVVALVVVSLLASGCGASNFPAPASSPAPVSLPVPKDGEVTFYLSLPSSTSALFEAAAEVATPGSSDYRHFSSLEGAARQYGASDAQITTVA